MAKTRKTRKARKGRKQNAPLKCRKSLSSCMKSAPKGSQKSPARRAALSKCMRAYQSCRVK